jgi:two-component system sensor histidine kinase MprB
VRLQARLALTVALAAAISILVMASAFWVLSARQQQNSVDESLLRVVDQSGALISSEFRPAGRGVNQDGRPGRRQGILEGVFENYSGGDNRLFTRIRVTRANGEIVVDDGLPEPPVISDPQRAVLTTVEIDGEKYRMASSAIGSDRRQGVLQIARNIEDSNATLGRLRLQILLGSLLGVALAAGLGALVARRLTAPISEVAAAAQAMATHRDLPSRIEVTRSDEVGELATSFNQMLSALELSRDQQKRLVADASHELRTPLTSLRLKIDLLDSNPELPDGQRRELLESSAAEVEQLSDLVSELVDLATDPTGVEEKPSTQSLVRLVNEVAERSELMGGREISVVALDGQRDVVIRARMVRRAVSNLLDNALKYSTVGSPVTVHVENGRIEVRDAGEGIPDADLEHVFDRFFRSPKARTRPGNGIGLAIVQRVADIHGGTTWAHNADDGAQGAIVGFSVSLDGPFDDVAAGRA